MSRKLFCINFDDTTKETFLQDFLELILRILEVFLEMSPTEWYIEIVLIIWLNNSENKIRFPYDIPESITQNTFRESFWTLSTVEVLFT